MTMDSGMFQCLASNPAGNIQSSAFLNVFHAGNKLPKFLYYYFFSFVQWCLDFMNMRWIDFIYQLLNNLSAFSKILDL